MGIIFIRMIFVTLKGSSLLITLGTLFFIPLGKYVILLNYYINYIETI